MIRYPLLVALLVAAVGCSPSSRVEIGGADVGRPGSFVSLETVNEGNRMRVGGSEIVSGAVLFGPQITATWPLWPSDDGMATVEPHAIPLSEDLKRRLAAWSAKWNLIASRNDWVFPEDDALRAELNREAKDLCREVEFALGEGWTVHYVGLDVIDP